MWEIGTTVACVVLGAGLLGWFDRFHLIVGLPVLVVAIFLYVWLRSRGQTAKDEWLDDPVDETAGGGRQVAVGLLQGGVAVLLLQAVFTGVADTRIEDIIRGPQCRASLHEISILAQGQAYQRIVQIVDTQLLQPVGPSCRQALREQQVRALLAVADQVQGEERIQWLEAAEAEARNIGNDDLERVAATRLQHERLQQQVAALKTAERPIQPDGEKGEPPTVVLPDMLFESGKAELTAAALGPLARIAEMLNEPPFKARRVRIEGHTDDTGPRRLNEKLSRDRAERVAAVLISHGVSEGRLVVEGFGAQRLLTTGTTPAGRAQNRRVEIVILSPLEG